MVHTDRNQAPTALAAGIGVLALAWLGPLPALAHASFAAHMTLHMTLVAVVAPLLVLGIAGTRWDPLRRRPWLAPALPASVLELVVVWSWHAPALHSLARNDSRAFAIEQLTFLIAGLAVWLAAFGGDATSRTHRAGPGIAALLMTSTHMTLLGVVLALSGRSLYETHGVSPLGLGPLEEQQLGGVVMLAVGGISYLAGGLWLLYTRLLAPAPPAGPVEILRHDA
jgi:putative membrane protein